MCSLHMVLQLNILPQLNMHLTVGFRREFFGFCRRLLILSFRPFLSVGNKSCGTTGSSVYTFCLLIVYICGQLAICESSNWCPDTFMLYKLNNLDYTSHVVSHFPKVIEVQKSTFHLLMLKVVIIFPQTIFYHECLVLVQLSIIFSAR